MTASVPAAAPGGPGCPSCGTPASDGPTCDSCGAVLPPPATGAVLVADLAGWSDLCASVGDDGQLLVRPLMGGLRATCAELGGAVRAHAPDRFSAAFAPSADDAADAALLAVTAARRLQELTERRRAVLPELPSLRVVVDAGTADGAAAALVADADPAQVTATGALVEGLVAALGTAPSWLSWSPPREVGAGDRRVPVHHLVAASDADPAAGELVTPLVGRSAELGLLEGAVAAVVTGEAGIGKSRLVAAWAERAGRRVLSAACLSFATHGPRQVLGDLLRPLGPDVPQLVGPTAARRALRLLGQDVDSSEPDSAAEQLSAVVEVLVAAGQREPLAVVVEDVHWASAEVLDVLAALLAAATDRVRVLLTGRELPLDRAGGALHVGLRPLSDGEVDELVGHLLPGADEPLRAALRSRTGGLPLFVEQCARLLVEDGTVALTPTGSRLVEPDGLRRVPTGMRQFVSARLDLLSGGERAVLDAAAVAGDTVEPELLRHLASHDVADEVESLVRRGLLEWSALDGGPGLRFRHAVVRDVVYEGQRLARKAETHRNAAEWFSVRLPRESLLGRALHLEAAVALEAESGAVDCDLVAKAAGALALLAHGILVEDPLGAVAAAERGLALVAAHPECRVPSLDLDVLAAEAYEELGRNDDARPLAERALAAAEAAGDELGTARAALVLGRVEWDVDPERSRTLLARADELFERRGDAVGQASVQVELAHFGHFDSIRGWVEAHERAFHAAEWAADFRWSNYMAQMLAVHSHVEGREHLDRWTAAAKDRIRTGDTAGRGRLVLADAMFALYAHDLDRATELAARALELGTEAGVRHTMVNSSWIGLEAAGCAGRLDEGEGFAASLDALLEARSTRMLELNRLLHLPLLRSRQGRREEAEELLARAREELGDGEGMRAFVRDVRCTEARVALDRGDLDEAHRLAGEAAAASATVDEPFAGLRVRLLHMAAAIGRRVTVPERLALGREARERGAPYVHALTSRWLELDDLLRGDMPLVAVQLPEVPPGAEARALDHEVRSFLDREPARLLEASREWRRLGTTHLPARSLLWYAAITGDESHTEEAREVLRAAGAPDGLEDRLRSQPEPARR